MRIYVGNLSYETSEDDLRAAFSAHGKVDTATVVRDRETGRSRGFGFVEMASATEAQAAIAALNGKEVGQRTLTVNEARPREERGFGGSGGGSGGFRGGSGGGGGRGGDRGGDRGDSPRSGGGGGGGRTPRW